MSLDVPDQVGATDIFSIGRGPRGLVVCVDELGTWDSPNISAARLWSLFLAWWLPEETAPDPAGAGRLLRVGVVATVLVATQHRDSPKSRKQSGHFGGYGVSWLPSGRIARC